MFKHNKNCCKDCRYNRIFLFIILYFAILQQRPHGLEPIIGSLTSEVIIYIAIGLWLLYSAFRKIYLDYKKL